MSCRCDDIRKYNKQLSNLKKALSYANKAISSSSLTNDDMVTSGTAFKDAVILNQAEESIGEELINGYKEAVTAIQEVKDEIDTAIEKISAKLMHLKAEDRRHHDHDDD